MGISVQKANGTEPGHGPDKFLKHLTEDKEAGFTKCGPVSTIALVTSRITHWWWRSSAESMGTAEFRVYLGRLR